MQWNHLNEMISKKRPDATICCGDFGYWVTNDIFVHNIKRGEKKNMKLFWLPGNHENFWALFRKYVRRHTEPILMDCRKKGNQDPNDFVFYCPLGSVLRVNHINVLFVGGADSFDKNVRTIGVDWFPDEILSPKDAEIILESVQDRNIKIDVVISHTVPMGFDLTKSGRVEKNNDPTRHALSLILSVLKPSRWWAGHWHFYATGYDNDCKWTVLDYPGHLHQYYEEVIFE